MRARRRGQGVGREAMAGSGTSRWGRVLLLLLVFSLLLLAVWWLAHSFVPEGPGRVLLLGLGLLGLCWGLLRNLALLLRSGPPQVRIAEVPPAEAKRPRGRPWPPGGQQR